MPQAEQAAGLGAPCVHMACYIVQMEINPQVFEDELIENRWDSPDYALHSMVNSKFRSGDVNHLQPFRLMRYKDDSRNDRMVLLGYSGVDEDTLKSIVRHNRPSREPQGFQWETFSARPFPLENASQPGRRLGFELRFVPTQKRQYDHGRKIEGERALYTASIGLHSDTGFSASSKAEEWLHKALQFHQPNGSEPIQRCRIENIVRPLHVEHPPRQFRRHERMQQFPAVTAKGALTVCDSEWFRYAITHGVGRHLAYGYGMLLLKPANQGV